MLWSNQRLKVVYCMLDWVLEHNGFIIEAAILALIVLYVGLKIK